MATEQACYFTILPTRGQYGAEDLLGGQPSGIVVSDRYASYNFIPVAHRQVCWAHLLRDFARIALRPGTAGKIGKRLVTYGHLLFRWVKKQTVTPDEWAWLQRRIERLLCQAIALPCEKTARTCQNLLDLWPALWTFVTHPEVPPTNNLVERAIRSLVLCRKISYVTRSKRGIHFVQRMFSVAQTCRLQCRSVYDFMIPTLVAWFHQRAGPSLVPSTSGSC
jgi:transposase